MQAIESEIVVVVAVASSLLPRQPPSTNETFIIVILCKVVIVAVLRQLIDHLGIRNRNYHCFCCYGIKQQCIVIIKLKYAL